MTYDASGKEVPGPRHWSSRPKDEQGLWVRILLPSGWQEGVIPGLDILDLQPWKKITVELPTSPTDLGHQGERNRATFHYPDYSRIEVLGVLGAEKLRSKEKRK